MAHIHLIRHGQASFGQASFGQANYDRLSQLGQRQAEVLGRHYARSRLPVAGLWCGDMARQTATAELARGHNPDWPACRTDAAFNEYDAEGLFRAYLPRVLEADPQLAERLQGKVQPIFADRGLFQRVFTELMGLWVSAAPAADGVDAIPSWRAFIARVQAGLERLHLAHARDDQVLVFSSGGVISVAVRLALGLDDRHSFEVNWVLANAGISRLRSRDSGLQLHSFNSTAHLELAGDSQLITYR